jgi:hypothetical protein
MGPPAGATARSAKSRDGRAAAASERLDVPVAVLEAPNLDPAPLRALVADAPADPVSRDDFFTLYGRGKGATLALLNGLTGSRDPTANQHVDLIVVAPEGAR